MLTQSSVPINTGISQPDRQSIVNGLERMLADSYMMYLKTLYYHWNVTGPMFQPLHNEFEQQYEQMATAVDDIAERIRALGFHAPGTFKQFTRLTSISEEDTIPDSDTMIKNLVEGHEAVIRTTRDVLKIARDSDDEATMDLLIKRIDVHEKTAWMLRSFLKE